MSDDPICAAIAEHKLIHKARAFDLYTKTDERLFRTVPTTVAGVLALLDYTVGKGIAFDIWAGCSIEFPRPVLRAIPKGLKVATERSAEIELNDSDQLARGAPRSEYINQ